LFRGHEANYEISNKIEGGLAATQAGLFQRVSLDVFGYTIFIVTYDKNFMGPSEREDAFCRPKIFTSINLLKPTGHVMHQQV
jgi:hypothetical protein